MSTKINTAWIVSCKLQATGWLVNKKMFIPEGNSRCEGVLAWIAEGNTPEPEYSDAELFTRAKKSAKEAVISKATGTRGLITNHADCNKVAGWGAKISMARKVIDKTASAHEVSVIKVEASQRGENETVLQLAKKQLAKGEKLAMVAATIDGMEDRVLKALSGCTTVEEINTLLSTAEITAQKTLALQTK